MIKKRYLFLIMLVCLFSISAVSAHEIVNETNELSVDNEDSIELIKYETDSDVLYTNPDGTFAELQKKIDNAQEGSTIDLDKNYIYPNEFSGTLTIDKELIINGNGHIIDGNRKAIINFNKLTMNNIVVTNSHMSGGSIKATNCNFTNNFDFNTHNGGAIKSNDVDVINCKFYNNMASFGGAIYCNSIIANNCEFVGNEAGFDNGAIAIMYADSNSTIINCLFKNNIADFGGGALSNAKQVINCEFIDNYAYIGTSIENVEFIINNTFKSTKNIDEFIRGDTNIILKNNKISSDNKYDIKIWGNDQSNATKLDLYLVFNNKTIVPNSTIELCQFQDDSGNKIIFNFEENPYINVALLNKDTGDIKNLNLTYNDELKGYFYDFNMSEGVYDVAGSIKSNLIGNYKVKNGILIIDNDTNYTLTPNDLVKYYHGAERFEVTLRNGNNRLILGADINITINGVKYTRTTDNNGVASMAINLGSGTYNVSSEYNEAKAYSTITVKSTVSGENITKMFRNGTQYYATFVDTSGKTLANHTAVEFNINGVFYTRYTNEKGVARMNINLNPGEYIITAKNPNSNEQYTNTITILPSIVEVHDLTKYYKNESKLTFRLLDDQGRPVGAGVSANININGVFYTRQTNASGYVNMNINLNPGTYIATLEYNGLMASSTVKVLHILEAKDVNMRYKDGTKFEAKLVDGQGKPFAGQSITFNINGVFYNRPTDENGIARLAINLMAGEYIITSMYEPNGAAISNKVTVRS